MSSYRSVGRRPSLSDIPGADRSDETDTDTGTETDSGSASDDESDETGHVFNSNRRASGDEAALHAAGFSVVEIADLKVRAAAITTKSSTWSHTVDRILVSCIVVGFLIHSTVSKAALRLFTCIEIGGMT